MDHKDPREHGELETLALCGELPTPGAVDTILGKRNATLWDTAKATYEQLWVVSYHATQCLFGHVRVDALLQCTARAGRQLHGDVPERVEAGGSIPRSSVTSVGTHVCIFMQRS
jgi:hypothetical protein